MPAAKLFLLAFFLASSASAQVSISVQTNKTEYLEGEPIIVLITVENIGAQPVPYGSGCDSDVKLSIEKQDLPSLFPRYGCFRGFGGGGACWGIDHHPHIQPGNSVTFKHLLKGYQLSSGRYTVQASGKALFEDKIEGNHFSKKLGILVRPATEQELRDVYAPLIAAAQDKISSGLSYHELEDATSNKALARAAISEMAPAFLEVLITSFVQHDQGLAVGGLARMNTPTSRRALVGLFEHSSDKDLREMVARELAHLGHHDQFDFFSGLLLGEHASSDPKIQSAAIEGMGRIGGEEAVQVLASFHSDDPELNDDANYALGVTRSPHAVSVLIERSELSDNQDEICAALATLTHRQWCSVQEDRTQYWRKWWSSHEPETSIYGDDNCDGALDAKPIS